jgi:hypothetical protein
MLKGSTYTTSPSHYDIKFFRLQGLFNKYFALEPLLKLATFAVAEVNYQNVKKKVTKIIPRTCNRCHRKRGQKTGTFFQNRYFSNIKFSKNMFKVYFAFKDIK